MDLEDGMVVGEDILTDSGIMVIPAGVVITRPIVAHLMSLGVDEVIIDDSVQAAGQDETLSAEQYVDENATVDQPAIEFYEPNNDNFKKFSKEYSDTKDKLNKTFESFIEKTISNFESGQNTSIGQSTYTILKNELNKIKTTMGENIVF